MRFLYPEYLRLFFVLAALLPLWLYQLFVKHRTRRGLAEGLPWRRISNLSSLGREAGRYVLLNLVLAALILAIAHPQRIEEKTAPQQKRMAIVFLLDVSPSMRAQDIWPSRLERALEVIGNFSRRKPPDDRIGLVSFSGGSLVLSYFTEDPSNILYYLDYLRDDRALSHGTDIGRALKSALTIIEKELEANPQAVFHKKIFVLVSDGEDHGAQLESAVREVKRKGIRVHTIGIGSAEGAPIPIAIENGSVRYLEDEQGNKILSRFDEKTLRWVAEETEGSAYRAPTGHELEAIFKEIFLKEREIEGFKKTVEHRDLYTGFLLAALGIFFGAMLL